MPLNVKSALENGVAVVRIVDLTKRLFLARNALIFLNPIAGNVLQKGKPYSVSAPVLTAGTPAVVAMFSTVQNAMQRCATDAKIVMIMIVHVRVRRILARKTGRNDEVHSHRSPQSDQPSDSFRYCRSIFRAATFSEFQLGILYRGKTALGKVPEISTARCEETVLREKQVTQQWQWRTALAGFINFLLVFVWSWDIVRAEDIWNRPLGRTGIQGSFDTKSNHVTMAPHRLGQESLVLFDRAGGLPHIALQLPVPPKDTLPKEAGLDLIGEIWWIGILLPIKFNTFTGVVG